MKKLCAAIACFALSTLIGVAGAAGKAPKIEGTWTATGGIIDGKKLEADEVAKVKLVVTIKDGQYSVAIKGKEVEAGTYKLDPGKKPAAIDLTITKGESKGKSQLGIYQLDGDQLIVVIAAVDIKERPKTFEGARGVEVTTLKRSK